jgi:putative phosphoribosyl transferase
MVLLADGSGRSRHSTGNRHLAGMLQERGIGTLSLDLLTEAEQAPGVQTRPDITLLAGRLGQATDWLQRDSATQGLRMGYFGTGAGAGAALVAAAERRTSLGAVIALGGRPDLAGTSLRHLKAPTLLIVGSEDKQVVELNRKALYQMQCEKELETVAGAGHLLDGPGALEQVADLAVAWFERHLGQSTTARH